MSINDLHGKFNGKEFEYISNYLDSEGYSDEKSWVQRFEEEVSKHTGVKYAVACNSGTSGLHMAMVACGIGPGDEVITPGLTVVMDAYSVIHVGAKPVFADVDRSTYGIDVSEIKKKITKKTKGIMIVHMAGHPCEVNKILNFCKKKKIILIEDCAHALGTFINKKHAGNFGISGSFSFYPTKQITTGEGGAVITNDKKFYKKIKMLKAFGIDKDIKDRKKQGDYDVKSLGYNYRMTDFQAALGLNQIVKYRKNLKQRHLIAKRYIKKFSGNIKISHMPYSKDCSFFIFQIFCKNRDKILKELKKKNIGVSVHYSNALPKMTYYKNKYNLSLSKFKNANNYGSTNISLPVYPKLEMKEIDKICKTVMDLI